MDEIKMGDSYTDESQEVKEPVEKTEEDASQEDASTSETQDDTSESEDATSQKTEAEEVKEEEEVVDNEIQGLETEKDKLLREIRELRQERREIKTPKETPIFTPKEEKLDDVDPTSIEIVEKVLKAKGYVRKDEFEALSYQDKSKFYIDMWLEKHPEYKPENDPDDKKWTVLTQEFSLYKQPSDPTLIPRLLDKCHASISPRTLVKSSASNDAGKEKLKATSKGAGGSGTSKTPAPKVTGIDKSIYSGFTEEELKEMGL